MTESINLFILNWKISRIDIDTTEEKYFLSEPRT